MMDRDLHHRIPIARCASALQARFEPRGRHHFTLQIRDRGTDTVSVERSGRSGRFAAIPDGGRRHAGSGVLHPGLDSPGDRTDIGLHLLPRATAASASNAPQRPGARLIDLRAHPHGRPIVRHRSRWEDRSHRPRRYPSPPSRSICSPIQAARARTYTDGAAARKRTGFGSTAASSAASPDCNPFARLPK